MFYTNIKYYLIFVLVWIENWASAVFHKTNPRKGTII
jgi:hypothetical protein